MCTATRYVSAQGQRTKFNDTNKKPPAEKSAGGFFVSEANYLVAFALGFTVQKA